MKRRAENYATRPPDFYAATRKMRKCLGCGNEFESQSAGHRICKICKQSERHTSKQEEQPVRTAALRRGRFVE